MSTQPAQTPKPPDNLGRLAAERVAALLAGRLQRARIKTSRPDWYFQTQAQEPQAYAEGWQVRVRTWRHWSDARVHLDADSGAVMHRCVDRLAGPPTEKEMSEPEALSVAAQVITIPPGARLASLRHEYFADGHKVVRLEWQHYHHGLRVDGDYLWIMVHPATHKLVAFGRKWRTVS